MWVGESISYCFLLDYWCWQKEASSRKPKESRAKILTVHSHSEQNCVRENSRPIIHFRQSNNCYFNLEIICPKFDIFQIFFYMIVCFRGYYMCNLLATFYSFINYSLQGNDHMDHFSLEAFYLTLPDKSKRILTFIFMAIMKSKNYFLGGKVPARKMFI